MKVSMLMGVFMKNGIYKAARHILGLFLTIVLLNIGKDYYAADRATGSVGQAEGNTLLVTILVSDPDYIWDLSGERDKERLESVDWALKVSTEFITEAAASWGKELHFIYDTSPGSDLLYEQTYTISMAAKNLDDAGSSEISKYEERQRVLKNDLQYHVPSEHLKEKYNTDNIGYLFIINTEADAPNLRSHAETCFVDGSRDPEYACINFFEEGWQNPPAVYAHEILHLFGAPDLYMLDSYDEEYKKLILDYFQNDIMYQPWGSGGEGYTKESYLKVDSEIMQLTAFYLGWTDQYPNT